jgi:general secretion pathway protein I
VTVKRLRLFKPRRSGFTLLEVMVSMAIMLFAYTAMYGTQNNSIRGAERARDITMVSYLAKNAMIETEMLLEGKKFGELDKEKTGVFPAPNEKYSWKREIVEIEFPDISKIMSQSEEENNSGSSDTPSPSAQMGQMAKLVSNFLSKSIREVKITILWKQGKFDQQFTVSQYWVDLNNEFSISE